MSQHELALDPSLPLREALGHAFRDIVGFAAEMVALAPADPDTAVHDYRRSLRRARAMTALTAPALKPRAHDWIATSLKAAFQQTSELRDHSVLSPALEQLAPALTEPAVVAQLRAHLAAERGVVVVPAQVARTLRRCGRHLAGLGDTFAAQLRKGVDDEVLRESLRASYAFTRDAYRRVRRTRRTKHLHAWRKAVKALRYQLELLASGGGGGFRRPLRAVAVQARLLGDVTDTMALRDFLAGLERELGDLEVARTCDELDRVIRARLDEAIKVAAGFYQVAVKKFAPLTDGDEAAEDDAASAVAAAPEVAAPAPDPHPASEPVPAPEAAAAPPRPEPAPTLDLESPPSSAPKKRRTPRSKRTTDTPEDPAGS